MYDQEDLNMPQIAGTCSRLSDGSCDIENSLEWTIKASQTKMDELKCFLPLFLLSVKL